jgi:4-amino-4-deoxy-L-arabinose transferase-like glycosyltransferase
MIVQTRQSGAIHADAELTDRARVPSPKAFSPNFTFFILFVALLANAAIVLVGLQKVGGFFAWSYSVDARDADLYKSIAKNLERGNGYRVDADMGPTMIREPGYPLFLAAALKLGGDGIQIARVGCVVLAFGAALVLLLLTRKITSDATTALAAALLFLLYPGTLVAEARAGIEMPAILTVMLFMLALFSAVEKGSLWWYWAAGLLLGVAVLVRSQVLLFPPVLLVYLLFASKSTRERVKVTLRIAALGLGMVVVVSPWIIRNYRLAHKLAPIATVAGIAAQEGLYACENTSDGTPFFLAQTRAGFERAQVARQLGMAFKGPYYQLFYSPQDELAFNQALLSGVATEYRSHPELLARCSAKNLFFNFWFLGKTRQTTLLNVVLQAPLLGLALTGVLILWKRGLLHKTGIVLLYTFYIPVVQAPIIAHARHSMFIVPFLAILGAVSLVSVWRVLRMRNSGTPEQQTVPATSGE